MKGVEISRKVEFPEEVKLTRNAKSVKGISQNECKKLENMSEVSKLIRHPISDLHLEQT